VYWWAFVYHLLGRLEPHDFVIDVKNRDSVLRAGLLP